MTETPRTRAILRCLFASLGLCIPLYGLSIVTGGMISLWLIPAAIILNIALCITLAALTYSAQASNKETNPLCSVPAIFACFFVPSVWAAGMGMAMWMIFSLLEDVGDGLGYDLYYNIDMDAIQFGFGIPVGVLSGTQALLLWAVGILCILERKQSYSVAAARNEGKSAGHQDYGRPLLVS